MSVIYIYSIGIALPVLPQYIIRPIDVRKIVARVMNRSYKFRRSPDFHIFNLTKKNII